MNGKQRATLFLTAVTSILALFFPPFQLQTPKNTIINLGYGLLFSPPKQGNTYPGMVNIDLLIIELFVVVLVGGLFVMIFKGQKTD